MNVPHHTLVVDTDQSMAATIAAACPRGAQQVHSLAELAELATRSGGTGSAPPASEGDTVTVVFGPSCDADAMLEACTRIHRADPRSGLILVRRRPDATLLTAALRAGVSEVLTDREITGLADAIERSRLAGARLRLVESTAPRAEITTVFSAKGGVGKTTVSTNLAVILSLGGARVALVDLDVAFGDVAVALTLFPAHTLADAAALGPALDPSSLAGMLVPHSSGVRVLAAPTDPGAADTITADTVTRALDILAEHFDHVVIDTPPSLDERVLAAIDASTRVALVATLDVPALKNLRIALETLSLIGLPPERQRIVINRGDAEVGVLLRDVPVALGRPIAAVIPSSRDVPASVNAGIPIVASSPEHAVSRALAEFADHHLTRDPARCSEPAAGRPARRSRWRRTAPEGAGQLGAVGAVGAVSAVSEAVR